MLFQRILLWSLLIAGCATAAYGIFSAGWLNQQIWLPEGAALMAAFAGAYVVLSALLIWRAPHRFLPAVAAVVIGYSLVAAGPLAVAGVLLVLLAACATGGLLLRNQPRARLDMPSALIVLGLAVWVFWLTVTARFPIHYWPLYLVLFAALIVWAWSRQVLCLPLGWPRERKQALWTALPVFPLLAHWLTALKPEVHAESLGIHLALPARMAAHHLWRFDVQEFAWAVKPMGGEWAFTLAYLFGGEAAARLLNFALFALICALLYTWLKEILPDSLAALLTAVFASLPLAHSLTGALRVENAAALFLLGALAFLQAYLKTGVPAYAYCAAFLTGAPAMVSMGALGFVLALGIAACLNVEWKPLLKGAPLALVPAALPYLEAAIRTGNPFFPYFNQYFGSPLAGPGQTLASDGGLRAVGLTNWFELTFHTSRFLEGFDGSLGFVFLILAPLCLIAIRRDWPAAAWTLLGVWVAGFFWIGLAGGSPVHLYIGLPVLTLSAGTMAASLPDRDTLLARTLAILLAAAFVLQIAMLPAAAPEHRGFALNQVFRPASVDEFLAAHAPQRPLVRELNRMAPHARVAWLESHAVAGFAGPVLSNSWHQWGFQQRIAELTSSEGLLFTANELDIQFFIAPAPDSPQPLSSVFTREFLDLYTQPKFAFGGQELRQLKPAEARAIPLQLPYAPPGRHDEVNSFVRFEGPWRRDLSFAEAYRGTLAYSNDLRARLFIRFHGRAITPIFTAAANRCTGVMTLDESEDMELVQFAGQTQWQARGPRLETAPGYHTLVIRLPQSRTTTSSVSSCFMDLDGFIVE
ncbi:MAG: hypothetical protein KJZ84_12565 [Bryobacteraceae bacterium]|nr:hypothetical protein [Bryobacteraceae bacterium]